MYIIEELDGMNCHMGMILKNGELRTFKTKKVALNWAVKNLAFGYKIWGD